MGKVKDYLYTQEFEPQEDDEVYHQELCEHIDRVNGKIPGITEESLRKYFGKNNKKEKQGVFDGKVGDVSDTF